MPLCACKAQHTQLEREILTMATGKVTMQTPTYYGPSALYPSENSYAGPNETVAILWKEGAFYYIEYTISTKYKRMYIAEKAVSNINGTVRTILPSLAKRYVITAAYTYTGPSANDFTRGNYLPAGTEVNFVSPHKEGDFAFVEVTVSGVVKRLWFEHQKLGPNPLTAATPGFYDYRANGFAITNSFGGKNGHLGIDAVKPIDPYVRAIAGGIVYSKSASLLKNNGYTITLRHQAGAKPYYSFYAHMESLPSIAVGSAVMAGQVLHPYGNAGNSSGPHIHCGVYTGLPMDDMYGYYRDAGGKQIPFNADIWTYKNRVFYNPEKVCATKGAIIS